MYKNFLIALLEEYNPDNIDIISNHNKLLEGVKSAFGGPGGKFFVAGKLISLFPEHKRYIEPFIGGGSVLFRKKKTESEYINDKDEEIYFLFKFMQDLTDQQLEALNKKDWTTKKDIFNSLLKSYKESPTKEPIDRFYQVVYLKCASDAGEMSSYDDRAEGEVMKLTERLMKIKERLSGITIENIDYKDFVKKHSNAESFTFLDPPYPSAKMNWKWCPTQEEFETFSKTVPGKWMITYEVCDGWKESKYYRKILSQYNLAAPSQGHMTRKSEMVITNYPMKENASYLSETMVEEDFWKDVADFLSVGELILPIYESQNLEEELKQILKLYASKRRGEEVSQSFEQLKTSFRNCISKMIKANITDFQPEKLSSFAKELFDKYVEYKYVIVQPDGSQQAFNSLKELKDSGIDYRGYKLVAKMKEAEKQIGSFALYHQWWKSKHLENKIIESFIIATDLKIDLFLDKDILSEDFKEAIFYAKPSKYEVIKVNESITFVAPRSNLNITDIPSWMKIVDIGKLSILESTELEKIIEFSGDKLKGIFEAKREGESNDFWTLKKSS